MQLFVREKRSLQIGLVYPLGGMATVSWLYTANYQTPCIYAYIAAAQDRRIKRERGLERVTKRSIGLSG